VKIITLVVEKITHGPIQENTWIVGSEEDQNGIIIDPGFDAVSIIATVDRLHITPKMILATHAHPDHVAVARELQVHYNIPFALHPDDLPVMQNMPMIANLIGMGNVEIPADIIEIVDNQCLEIYDLKITVIHTPGHTPGSVGFIVGDYLFSGDTLFKDSVGRTDLPGGNWGQLERSLSKLRQLAGDLTICPGHGETTKLARELRFNPFLRDSEQGH